MMRTITALLLLCISAFASAAPAPQAESSSDAQLANLLFNDPNSPRIGAKEPRLTIVSFTDYNWPLLQAVRSAAGKNRPR
ncbi:Uncharacterised protein [Raoultella terrigena]|uniref:Uncharacterized protein n=1 Tax=Raoultella terrigena TaxID=577 RepID=A0A3P8IRF4_RAOTE|nr:Uncharacterised protein [Raoultella terrigena]